MTEICGDNRFELIEKYKQKLISSTNIESSPEEIAMIDNILFRCWQIGWLDLLEKKESGLLIELPVPIGSEHYFIHPDKRRGIKKVKVVGCWKSANYDCDELNIVDVEGMFSYPIPFDDVKELLYNTREEAEARLMELKNGTS